MSRHAFRPGLLLVSILLLLSATVFLHPSIPSRASGASISLSPTFGPPTSSVQVKGSGFKGSETVLLLFDTTQIKSVTASSTGSFSVKVTIPKSALPGNHIIQAKGKSSGRVAQATFLVQTNWVQSGFNRQHTNFNPFENVLNPASTLTQHWTFSAGSLWCLCYTPVVANGLIYFSSDQLYALNATTGALVWSYPVVGNVATANGYVYVGADKLYALNASTGALVWSYANSTGKTYLTPLTANGRVYVGSLDNNVYAFDGIKGTLLWSYGTGANSYPFPALDNGALYVGANQLYVLNATTGTLEWSYATGSSISSLTIANNIIYLNSDKLYALNETTKTLEWSYNSLGSAVAYGMVYTISSDYGYRGIVNALNATTGKLIWSLDTSDQGGHWLFDPVVANGVVYVAGGAQDNTRGVVDALNAITGAFLWEKWDDGTTSAGTSAVVVNGLLYFGMGEDPVMFAYGL